MKRTPPNALFALTLALAGPAAVPCTFAADVDAPDAEREKALFFENKIRPILVSRCYDCHGEEKQRGGLRVDHIDHLVAGGDSGTALVAGDPDQSLLIEAVRYRNADFQMPPKEALPPEEVALLEQWVALGAPWPAHDKPATDPASTKDEHGFTQEERGRWALQPLAAVSPPEVKSPERREWVRTDIDRFIAAKHEEMQLAPAPAAGPEELVRRVYFDLHGLPPTPEQLQAFLADHDETAYGKLVDELLASPRYGERWAQHWLDLVRYAESDGYNADGYRPSAWPYRDWVIKALNDDMPYDQFVRYQLAGDEIAPDDPDIFIATSYLRNGIYEWNQRDVHGQWDLIVTDMTDNAGEVFLGLSFGCARCHDHKFDPILQEDYYRLKAFFTPVLWDDNRKLATSQELEEYRRKQAVWEEKTRDIRHRIDGMTKEALDRRVETAYGRFAEDIRAMIDKPVAERTAIEHQLASIAYRQMTHERVQFKPDTALKKEEDKKRYAELLAELKKFDHLKPGEPMEAFVATDAKPIAPSNLLKTRRGEMDVPAGFLKILEPDAPEIRPTETTTGRRSALADWITRPDNQLSTRVIVNRVWQYHFGRGIAGTPNDFGNMGERPTHPELLDWLARRFVEEGWSLKKLHKEILLSSVYRQTALRQMPEAYADADPANLYLWRFHPRRLDAEQARDAMLVASGELDLSEGGPSVSADQPRRSIYTMKKRNSQDEFLRSLDATANFTSVSERQSTTTPTQALYMMNGDWLLKRAGQLASRAGSIERAWELTLGRGMLPEERAIVEDFTKRRLEEESQILEEKLVLQSQPVSAGQLRADSKRERLVAKQTAPDAREGDEFTVEAVFTLDSIDTGGAVRTIASRWDGGTEEAKHRGWSLGVTGEKSRFQPRNLLLQAVGNDASGTVTHELLASDLRVSPGTPYHVVVRFSTKLGKADFQLTELGEGAGRTLTASKAHGIRSGISAGESRLVIGGLNHRAPSHQFHGHLDACRIVPGLLDANETASDPAKWSRETTPLVMWDHTRELPDNLAWSADVPDPYAKDAEFRPDTGQERLVASTPNRENESFTVEAMVNLRSIDANASVRTIASRWAGGQDKQESFGWSLGVTGEKSRFQPNNLIVQLVGFDDNDNINYEVVPSNLRLALNTPYHVAVHISCPDRSVVFQVTDLSAPGAETLTARARHEIKTGITSGRSNLVIGGMNSRNPSQQFDGRIYGCRILNGSLAKKDIRFHPEDWQNTPSALVEWNATRPISPLLEIATKDHQPEGGDLMHRVLADLCHVLLNSNEFLYLH